MSQTPLVDLLSTIPGGPRVALRLWLSYPKWKTAEELSNEMPFMSAVRIKQVLKALTETKLIERREKSTGQRGVQPFEYRLSDPLVRELERR
jgi:predicted transcriptional regulator